MRLSNRRNVRNLTCLTALLACVSAPLAAQSGIDLLDSEQVWRAGEPPVRSDGTDVVRITAGGDPTGVGQAAHARRAYRYDDGAFENFEDDSPLAPTASGGAVEWAQRFEVESDSVLVSARACFLRPDNDLSRSLDFKLRFYGDEASSDVANPGRRGGLSYTVEAEIQEAGTHRCVLLRGALVGKPLGAGAYWVGIEWNTATLKRLGGDHYTADDQAETDGNGRAVHETEVRRRTLPVPEGAMDDGWSDPRLGDRTLTASGLKAIGVSLVVTPMHEPEGDPDSDTDPPADSACSDGLCLLQDGRFRVRARYAMLGMSGQAAGTIAAALAGEAGLFTFGGDGPELLVRMVDNCSASGYFALYAGAATDAAYSIAVRDTTTDELRWFSAQGGAPIRDAMAFTCGN